MRYNKEKESIAKSISNLEKKIKASITGKGYVKNEDALNTWVFRDISFTVNKGEVLGIIGRNGCGKTTLLKILSRVLDPTEGRAYIKGRVTALLSVGTGFVPSFTGRENIFLNGALLGLSKEEINETIEDIIEFAEIGNYIDFPIRQYSSGMQARLAFSVAAHLDPEILILDEVLAVGDISFSKKCLNVMHSFKESGRTILIVSHNLGTIKNFCDRALLIQSGAVKAIGEPVDVIDEYVSSFQKTEEELDLSEREDREGSGCIKIIDIYLENGAGFKIDKPETGAETIVCFKYEKYINTDIDTLHIGFVIFDQNGQNLSRYSTEVTNNPFYVTKNSGVFKCIIPKYPYIRGEYMIGFRITADGEVADYIPNAYTYNSVEGDYFGTGKWDHHSPVYIEHEWQLT